MVENRDIKKVYGDMFNDTAISFMTYCLCYLIAILKRSSMQLINIEELPIIITLLNPQKHLIIA